MENESIFLVYFHRAQIDQKVFYVGVGKGIRPYQKIQRSKYWHEFVKENGMPIIEIIHKDITLKEAFELEKKYIKQFGKRINGTGALVNITDGGPGSGLKISPENRKKLIEAKRLKGTSDQTRKKMSLAKIGKKLGIRSDEHREKLSLSQKSSKIVAQYDKSMNFVAEHRSIHAAAKSVKGSAGTIFQCIRGDIKSSRGFIWKYKDVHD